MRRLFQSLAVAAAGTVVAALVASPASAVTTTVIKPGTLPRGAEVAVPHVEGNQIVDGALRITIKAPLVVLLGKSGGSYVVATGDVDGNHGRVLRVGGDGSAALIAKAGLYSTQLSDDGARIVDSKVPRAGKTIVTAWSVATGAVVAKRAFPGYVNVLDAKDDQVLLGSVRKTQLWSSNVDIVYVIAHRGGYAGDLNAGLLATFTKDPYRGGCSVVSRISNGEAVWRSCSDRVDAFSTDGSRLATVDLLSDGLGPTVVTARTLNGHAVGRYAIKNGWFGALTFESPTALLLETNGKKKAATIRCVAADCERASALRAPDQVRAAG